MFLKRLLIAIVTFVTKNKKRVTKKYKQNPENIKTPQIIFCMEVNYGK